MTIFNDSKAGRYASAQAPQQSFDANLPTSHQRTTHLGLPEVSELQAVRHFTRLAKKNYSIDTHFYPLGSCTMKYNPRGVQKGANHPDFVNLHPLADVTSKQGLLHCFYELQEYIKAFTGMHTVALTPMAGSQGEFVGVAMIRAYHLTRGDHERTEIIVPDAAHGTNPASAAMCGFKVREIPTVDDGDIDVEQLRAMVGPQTAGIMLTNPSTLGVFSRRISEIAGIVHQAGGLLYYDGANLNAILGKVRPGDMGFDVIHLNLHKTFATPHGGGGPGAGPVAVSERLAPFLPTPLIAKQDEQYVEVTQENHPQSIGRITTFMGNAGILLRAYAYIRLLGKKGLHNVAEYATLNANYLMARLQQAGFTLAYSKRRASHEFIITLAPEKKAFGITALDFAKRLLDYGFHAPTVYFPLCVPECLLIEPTETECKEELDNFIDAMIAIRNEAQTEPEKLQGAPYTTPVGRLDETKAARQLDLVWQDD